MSSECGVGAGSQSSPGFLTDGAVEDGMAAWLRCSELGCPAGTSLLSAPLSWQSEERSVLFAVGSALVNCTNSYDYEEPDPKMVELAKYAKQHVPEQHPKVWVHSGEWGEGGAGQGGLHVIGSS